MDQTTGTIRMKAEFPNKQLQLWPGQFVNIRMLVDTLRQVITVPTAAVQRGPNGTFVYVIDGESKAQVRPIKVAMLDDTRAVISDGLKSDERVVTTGFARLTEGTVVTVSSAEDAGQVTPGGQPRPDGTRGKRSGEKGKRNPGSGGPPAKTP